MQTFKKASSVAPSPSSRRAWIEIGMCQAAKTRRPVALLAEGVDRNTDIDWLGVGKNVSPSSRRAEDAARRGEHIGHLILLHDSGQIPAVAVITQQANPAELCCKVHLLR